MDISPPRYAIRSIESINMARTPIGNSVFGPCDAISFKPDNIQHSQSKNTLKNFDF